MRIVAGRVLLQRFFDFADEVRLKEAHARLERAPQAARFISTASKLRVADPPLELELGARECGVPGVGVVRTVARLYDLGALAITFDVPLPGPMTQDELIEFVARVADAHDSTTAAARPLLDEIDRTIAGATIRKDTSDIVEDYRVVFIERTEPPLDGGAIGEHLDLARILQGERNPITQTERAEILRTRFSYEPQELVVVDWNSAFVLDPTGNREVVDLLELASMQLLELRAYDQLTERALSRLYGDLGWSGLTRVSSQRNQKLSREAMRMYVELLKLAERFDNSLTMLGDTWLARVHRAAVHEFDVPRWHQQLERKVELLRQINELLFDQLSTRASHRMELAIIMLIILEIVLALLKVV